MLFILSKNFLFLLWIANIFSLAFVNVTFYMLYFVVPEGSFLVYTKLLIFSFMARVCVCVI
jgi:hypothetical protein